MRMRAARAQRGTKAVPGTAPALRPRRLPPRPALPLHLAALAPPHSSLTPVLAPPLRCTLCVRRCCAGLLQEMTVADYFQQQYGIKCGGRGLCAGGAGW